MTHPDLRCYEKLDFDEESEASASFSSGWHTPIRDLKQSGGHTPEMRPHADFLFDPTIPPPKLPVAHPNQPKKRALQSTDYVPTPVLFWNSSPSFDRCCQCDGYACLSACMCGRVEVCFECATGTYIERTLFNIPCYQCNGPCEPCFAPLLDEPLSIDGDALDQSQAYIKKAIYDFMRMMRPTLLPPLTHRIKRMYEQLSF